MKHPALNRILKQIEGHKQELMAPENSVQEHYLREKKENKELPPPEENIADAFTDEVLNEREEELRLAEQEEERLAKEGDKKVEEIAQKLENGGDLSEIPPPETEEESPKDLPQEVRDYLDSEKEEFEFRSCFDLRDFFERERDKFEEWAHPAIDSVLQAVASITSGCKCKIKERRGMVENYYVTFITQNQHNSLIGKMKEILKAKKLKFYSEEKIFLDI